jgi:hypothetical protein
MPEIASFPDLLSASTNDSLCGLRSQRTLHRQVKIAPSRLSDILCHREQRYVGAQLSFHYDRKQIILERSDISENLGGQYVELYDFVDRPLEVRWKGLLLPYRVFSKDQRVSHTAIVENKRLGHALAVVKAQQDLRRTPKVMTNSEKAGYRKRARMVNAPPLVLSDAQSREEHPPAYLCFALFAF